MPQKYATRGDRKRALREQGEVKNAINELVDSLIRKRKSPSNSERAQISAALEVIDDKAFADKILKKIDRLDRGARATVVAGTGMKVAAA